MSRSKRLFLVTLVLSSIINANNISLRDLNEQMHGITTRMSLYFKCLRGKCLPEERAGIEQKILLDATILVGSLIALTAIGTTITLFAKHRGRIQTTPITLQPVQADAKQAARKKVITALEKEWNENTIAFQQAKTEFLSTWDLYTQQKEHYETLEREYNAIQEAGLPSERTLTLNDLEFKANIVTDAFEKQKAARKRMQILTNQRKRIKQALDKIKNKDN